MTAYEEKICLFSDERLVDLFDGLVTCLTNEANFKKGGSTKKTYSHYLICRAVLLDRLHGKK